MKYKHPRTRAYERLHAQCAKARTSGRVRDRTKIGKPQQALRRLLGVSLFWRAKVNPLKS